MMVRQGLRASLLAAALLLGSCGTAINVANNTLSRATLDLSSADADDLRAGRIDRVRERYGTRAPGSLTPAQLSLYCDVLLKYRDFAAASACLDRYQAVAGGENARSVVGKRALIALALGTAAQAASLTSGAGDPGSRYVHALAEARQGRMGEARSAADGFSHQFEPKQVYYAANLYSAVGDNAGALRVLEDPQRRLLRDYGLTPNQTAFGAAALAPFRLDVFDEFSFGFFKDLSYAPAGNIYVEYLAAHSLIELGRWDEAARRLDVLSAFPGLVGYRDVQWLVLYDQARLAMHRGRAPEAAGLLRRSVDVIESVRQSVGSDEGRIGFASDKQAVYALLVGILADSGQTDAAFEYAERARGRALVDLLASRNDLVPAQMSRAEAESSLDGLRRAEGQEALAAAVADAPGGAGSALRGSGSAGLRRSIAQRAPTLAPLVGSVPVDLAAIRRDLAPDETAIAYYATGPSWIAFVVSQSELRTVRLPMTDTARTVLGFVKAVVSTRAGGDAQAYMPGARALYDGLIRPMEPYIAGKRLVLVPYGILHYVPFAALHDGSGFLIQKHGFRQVPSLSALTVAPSQQAGGGGSLVIGNPSRSDAPNLPSAQQEATEVGRILSGSTVLLRGDATLDRFRALSSSREFIHIASHGQFDSRNPLQSRLLLAPDAGNNGDLLVGSLYSLRLNAKLVTLSACETAVNQVSDGDDLVGLTRGFLFAGTQNVVATLWEIDDAATGSLMGSFYAAVAQNVAVPEALRQAQLETMKRYPQPFFWAPFVPTSFSRKRG